MGGEGGGGKGGGMFRPIKGLTARPREGLLRTLRQGLPGKAFQRRSVFGASNCLIHNFCLYIIKIILAFIYVMYEYNYRVHYF